MAGGFNIGGYRLGKTLFPYVGAAQSFLLDQFGGAAAAYSLQKLSSTYSGSAVRVRESGGNTEADIGFNADGTLDTTALLAHCGANDGFVRTWYDQKSTYDLGQSTTTDQPKIVTAGVVETDANGNPAIKFNGTSSYLVSSVDYTSEGWGFMVYDPTVNTEFLLANAANVALTISSNMRIGIISDQNDFALPNLNNQLGSFKFGTSPAYWVNGSSIAVGADQTTGLSLDGRHKITLGCRNPAPGTPGLFWSSTMTEVVLYPTDQAANRTAIEANINDRYSIY